MHVEEDLEQTGNAENYKQYVGKNVNFPTDTRKLNSILQRIFLSVWPQK